MREIARKFARLERGEVVSRESDDGEDSSGGFTSPSSDDDDDEVKEKKKAKKAEITKEKIIDLTGRG